VTGTERDMVVHEQEPYNAEPTRSALAEHVVAPVGVFYGRNHGTMPNIAREAWRLRVDGLVDRPLELSLADLQERFAHREVVATLQCAGNRRAGLMAVRDIPGQHPWGPGATSTARWGGVSLADVHPRVAMQILRHAQFALTMEIYTLASPAATKDALKRLGASLDR
jgi:sulfite oxidase